MRRLPFSHYASLALLMTLAFSPLGRTQTESTPQTGQPPTLHGSAINTGTYSKLASSCSPTTDRAYKIYSLSELGNDPGFGEWVAQTIPEVIASGTWKGPGVIRYYAPKNILVVCHTAAVQAEVSAFLKDMKKALPTGGKSDRTTPKARAANPEVVPATYTAPALLKTSSPMPEASTAYPVPAQAKPPKHLFHFIIRYEGEGLVDDNIVKAMKAYYQGEQKAAAAGATASGVVSSPDPILISGGSATPAPPPPSKERSTGKEKEEKKEGQTKDAKAEPEKKP